MKLQFALLYILLSKFNFIKAQDIQWKMDSLRKKERFYSYTDKKNKKEYTHGLIEQIYGFPVFRKVEVDKAKKIILIEGITTIQGSIEDTTERGFCCFEVFVAKTNSQNDSTGSLYDIRRFGKTNNRYDNSTKRDGFFQIKVTAASNDILVIGNPGGAGAGILIYNIGKLLKKEE